MDARQGASALQILILTGEKHHELTGLRVVGVADRKSIKLNSQPLAEKPSGDRRALAPRREDNQRKGLPQRPGQYLRQGIGCGANLRSQCQRCLRLLPQIVDPPPSLGVNFHHILGRQVDLGRQNPVWPRLSVVRQAYLAPHRAYRKPLQESRHGNYRAHANRLHLAAQRQFHLLCRPRFGRKKQGCTPPHLSHDADLLFEQGQNQTVAHEPRIDQQTHRLGLHSDRNHPLPRHLKLAAPPRLLKQPGATRHCQSRSEPNTHDQRQCDPALAVQECRSIDLVTVIVLDADPRPELPAARHQRFVEDKSHDFGRTHHQHQLQQAERQFGSGHVSPLDQFVIGRPVRLLTTGPMARVTQPSGLSMQLINNSRKVQLERGGTVIRRKETHSESSKQTLVTTSRTPCHAKRFLEFSGIFRATAMPSASVRNHMCLNFG